MTVPGKGGRPLKFKTVEELSEKIDAYFDKCEIDGAPLTVMGLCVALECDRETLLRYGKKEEFYGTIKNAKNKIAAAMEIYALGAKNPAGPIFLLKANYNYSDKLEIEHSGAVHLHFDEQDRKLIEGEDD